MQINVVVLGESKQGVIGLREDKHYGNYAQVLMSLHVGQGRLFLSSWSFKVATVYGLGP